MKKNLKDKKSLNIAMLGHKRIPSREGGIEIVVEELSTRMVTLGHKVTCYAWMMTKEFINRRHTIFSSISMQVNVPERSRRIFQICLFIRNMRMIMKWMRFLHWRRFRKKY